MFTRVARGFEELADIGLIERRPIRFVGGQAAGCSPVATAFEAGTDVIEPVRQPDTIVRSLAIGNPADGRYAVELRADSGGSVEAIADAVTAERIRDVARLEGIFPETAGGVTLGAVAAARRRGVIREDDEVVALLTGERAQDARRTDAGPRRRGRTRSGAEAEPVRLRDVAGDAIMSTVRIPPTLRTATGGEKLVSVPGGTVREVIRGLVDAHPGLESQLLSQDGDLNRFVNAFLNDTDVRHLQALETPVGEGDTLVLLPAMAGGLRTPRGYALDLTEVGWCPTSDRVRRTTRTGTTSSRKVTRRSAGCGASSVTSPMDHAASSARRRSTGPVLPSCACSGSRPSDKNPNVCTRCFTYLADHHGGAEIEASMMFADIRGSTSLAERMSTAEFHAILDRFYVAATKAVFDNDGSLDKFVGDEVVAFFFPNFVGQDHAAAAISAATDLLRATGHEEAGGPWVPVGAGVATGIVWAGAVGTGAQTDITAIGDTVNTTARLASAAKAGEVLVTTEAARQAGLDPHLETRTLDLKGKAAGTEVVTLNIGPQAGRDQLARSSAWRRSAMRSSTPSMPTDRRISAGSTARAVSETDMWVIAAGTSTSDSTPPSDSASVNSFVPSATGDRPVGTTGRTGRGRQERDHPTEAGIADLGDIGSRSQELDDRTGIRLVPLDPDVEGCADRGARGSNRAGPAPPPSRSGGTAGAPRRHRPTSPPRPVRHPNGRPGTWSPSGTRCRRRA
jgi:adenylate cyclase